MREEPGDYALVIGIDDYPLYGANGRNLKGAIHDARLVCEWLTNKTIGGGLPPENCHLITSTKNTVDSPQPRKAKVDDAFEQLRRQAVAQVEKSGVEPRRFYFYFSGHGQSLGTEDVALCMANWSRSRPSASISFKNYQEFVVNCLPFKEVVILLDCCRSRKINARAVNTELGCEIPSATAGQTQIFVAYATEFQAAAFEGGQPALTEEEEPIVHGHFTEALLAGLRGGAARPPGGVPASRLWTYLNKVVPRIARRHRHEQTPRIIPFSIPPEDPCEPVFGAAPRIETVDVKIGFTARRQGPIKLEGPALELIRQGEAASGPWEDTLPLATYLLTDLGTKETQAISPHGGEGEIHVEF